VAKRDKKPRNEARITAFAEDGKLVREIRLSLDEYYEDGIELIDSSVSRQKSGIRSVKGELLDGQGRLTQQFENQYDATGRLVHSRAVHDDGTISEQNF
jgi:hypothetical protein